ncbi:hypothetical protein [Dipodfec virus UOA04_Rod_986]|nr:hypothetical protein [Dipodfec virus UOA04_Rod_986]
MIDFLEQNWQHLLYAIVLALVVLFDFIKNKRLNSVAIKELKNMIERANPWELKQTPGQTFSEIEPEYTFNEKTKALEVTGEINVQEQIQSMCECALDKVLEKYGILPEDKQMPSVPQVDGVADVDDLSTDLDDALAAWEFFDEMREKYELPEHWNEAAIYDYLQHEYGRVQEYNAQKAQKEANNGVQTQVQTEKKSEQA